MFHLCFPWITFSRTLTVLTHSWRVMCCVLCKVTVPHSTDFSAVSLMLSCELFHLFQLRSRCGSSVCTCYWNPSPVLKHGWPLTHLQEATTISILNNFNLVHALFPDDPFYYYLPFTPVSPKYLNFKTFKWIFVGRSHLCVLHVPPILLFLT